MNPLKSLSPSARGVAAEFLAKIWMAIAVVFVALNLFIILTLFQIAPKLKIIPLILTSPMNSQEFIQTEPLESGTISDRKLIDEMILRYYLEMRFTQMNDFNEMHRRWGPHGVVASLSSPQVYSEFFNSGEGGMEQRYRNAFGQGFTVSVHITNISRWNNTYVVDFDLHRYANGKTNVEHKSATVTVAFNPNKYHFLRKQSANPYGMYVTTFTVRNKKQ